MRHLWPVLMVLASIGGAIGLLRATAPIARQVTGSDWDFQRAIGWLLLSLVLAWGWVLAWYLVAARQLRERTWAPVWARSIVPPVLMIFVVLPAFLIAVLGLALVTDTRLGSLVGPTSPPPASGGGDDPFSELQR